jgi:outer membrane lipoprotein-sorting protein
MVGTLVLLLAVPGAEPNGAEKLFRDMEARVANAKNVECEYEASSEGGKDTPVRGKLRLSDGGKCRTETLPYAALLPDSAVVCDGKRMVVLHEDVPTESREAPGWLPDVVRGKITRSFTARDPEQLAKRQDFKLEEQCAVADFKLGKKESVGEAEAQVVEFKLAAKGAKQPIVVTLWLDTGTNLPLKRVLVMAADDKETRVTETFRRLDLDAKPDPKLFELPNEAEQLFRRMEAKLVAAKTVECQAEVKMKAEKEVALKGTLLLAEGNKLRLEVVEEEGGKTEKGTLVSDGTTMAAVGDLPTKRPADTAPPWLAGSTRAALVRASLTVPTDFFVRRSAAKSLEFLWVNGTFRLSDFKLGKKETVGDREAQVVEYKLVLVGLYSRPIAVQLWIDTKTGLPLQRVLTAGTGDRQMTITESYPKLTLDEKIDPKQFELPKE